MAHELRRNQTENEMAWDDLRTSKAFPAIVGGLAGAGIGVAIMFIASRLSKPKKNQPLAYDGSGNPVNVVYLPMQNQFRILGFTVGDLVTLGTIGITMARQIQDMRRVQGIENALEAEGVPVAPADSPNEPPPSTLKKR